MEQNTLKIKTARIYICFVTIKHERTRTNKRTINLRIKKHVNTTLPVNITIEKVNFLCRCMSAQDVRCRKQNLEAEIPSLIFGRQKAGFDENFHLNNFGKILSDWHNECLAGWMVPSSIGCQFVTNIFHTQIIAKKAQNCFNSTESLMKVS